MTGIRERERWREREREREVEGERGIGNINRCQFMLFNEVKENEDIFQEFYSTKGSSTNFFN